VGLLDRIGRALRGDADEGPGAAAEGGTPGAPADAALVEELRAFVAERSDGKLAAADVDPAQHLFDSGYVDSLSSLGLLAFVEERTGVAVSEVDLVSRFNTLDALARHVRERAGA